MRWTWNTRLLESGSISLKIFFLIWANGFIFFMLGIFFDGGAYPWGEIRADRFLIVNNQGTREVTENWFWLTFWQGFSAWAALGLFFILGAIYDLHATVRTGWSKDILGHMAMLGFSSVWLWFVVISAFRIVT